MKNSFLQKFSITAIGSSIALIVPLITSPIIGRLYSPENFGSLSLFISTVGLISIISSGQIQNSLFEPSIRKTLSIEEVWSKYSSYTVFWISIFTFLFLILKWILKLELVRSVTTTNWVLIIVGACLTNFNSFLSPLIILDQKFKVFGRNKVFTSLTVSAIQLSTFRIWNELGLIFGNIAGLVASNYNFLRTIDFSFKKIVPISPFKVLKEFKHYTLYFTSSTLIGQINSYAPIYLLPLTYGLIPLGQYAFGMKLFQVPLNIFSKSIQEVFKQESSSEILEYGHCEKSFKKSFIALISISVIPFIIFIYTIEDIMPVIFGSQWKEAGTVLKTLAPSLFLKFTTSPLSFVFVLRKKQKIDLAIQLVIGLSISFLFLLGKSLSFLEVIHVLNLIYCIHYLIYLILSYQYSRR